jgi:hypothetical protein
LNKLKLAGALAGCCLAVWVAAAGAATNEAIAQREVKIYFPGDFVHIVVEAPPDTAAIGSLMPNNDRIELVHDRRANVWYGLWQVPIDFPSGTYTAVLEAKDMQGETFSGETAPFIIGELTMIMIAKQGVAPVRPAVQKTVLPARPIAQPEPAPVNAAPAPVKAVEQPVVEQKIAAPVEKKVVPAPPVAAPVEKKVEFLPLAVAPTPVSVAPVPRRALVPPDQRGAVNAAPAPAKKVKWSQFKWPLGPLVKLPVQPPAGIRTQPAPPRKVKTKPAPKQIRARPVARSQRPVNTRKMKFVEVGARRELSASESRLVTTTRYYMEKMEFDKVHDSLTSLIKLAPSDRHYRQMLRRVDKVIKTETEKNK